MSKLTDKENNLITKLNLLFANKYTIYTEIKEDGYKTPAILLKGYYTATDKTTDTGSKLSYNFDLFLLIDSPKGHEKQAQEELRNDFEKIMTLSGVELDSYFEQDNFNKSEPCKSIEFTINY